VGCDRFAHNSDQGIDRLIGRLCPKAVLKSRSGASPFVNSAAGFGRRRRVSPANTVVPVEGAHRLANAEVVFTRPRLGRPDCPDPSDATGPLARADAPWRRSRGRATRGRYRREQRCSIVRTVYTSKNRGEWAVAIVHRKARSERDERSSPALGRSRRASPSRWAWRSTGRTRARHQAQALAGCGASGRGTRQRRCGYRQGTQWSIPWSTAFLERER